MGYTTDFNGAFKITPEVTQAHADYINTFTETRRMKRNPKIAETFTDLKRLAVGLPIGVDGEFYIGSEEVFGQISDESVVEYNWPPQTQPGLWCHWVVDEDNNLIWDEGEKFYHYAEWLEYMIENFFKPWGYTLNGKMEWRGEEWEDTGRITVENNNVIIL